VSDVVSAHEILANAISDEREHRNEFLSALGAGEPGRKGSVNICEIQAGSNRRVCHVRSA
jgi:hypothetical protein